MTKETEPKNKANEDFQVNQWHGFKCPDMTWHIEVKEHWRDHNEHRSTNADCLTGTNEVIMRFYTLQEATAKRWFNLIPEYILHVYPYSENYYSIVLYHERTKTDQVYMKGGHICGEER